MAETPPPKPGRKFYLSLRIKLLTAFTILFGIVFAGAFLWFLNYATNSALSSIKADLVDTLNGAVAGINGDAFKQLAETGSATDPRYLSHLDWLKTVHSLEPRAFPYTYVQGSEPSQVLFIGDILMIVRPDDAAHFDDPYVTRGPMYQGLSSLTLNLSVYSDKWGSWISAYRPILDSAGQPVGAMGIDFTADYVNQVRQGVLDSIGIAFIITYALMFVMVALISQLFTRPLVRLTRITEEIGRGNLNQNFDEITNSLFPDEIVTLTTAYEAALGNVRGVVQNLTNQVVELQIVIDESQRKKNVSEIVESDFFRDLQVKAQKMRSQRSADPDAPVTLSTATAPPPPNLPETDST